MNITSPRIELLAQRLADLTGEDMETALARAIEERLSRIGPAQSASRAAALCRFFDTVSLLPVQDPRPIDGIVGYGPVGLPTA